MENNTQDLKNMTETELKALREEQANGLPARHTLQDERNLPAAKELARRSLNRMLV